MSRRRLLFFDDFPFASENEVFIMVLRRRVEFLNIVVVQERSINQLEERLHAGDIDCLVLDIMSEVPRGFRSIEGGLGVVPSASAGVEILRRCRAGIYKNNVNAIPIFMRTARGEPHIKKLCAQIGATGYFRAGVDDLELVEAIVEAIQHAS